MFKKWDKQSVYFGVKTQTLVFRVHMYGDNAALAIDKNADSQKYTWNGNMFD